MNLKSPSFRLYNPTNLTKWAPELIWQINQIRPVHPKSPTSSHLQSSCAQHFFPALEHIYYMIYWKHIIVREQYLISESNKNLILTPIPLLHRSQLNTAPCEQIKDSFSMDYTHQEKRCIVTIN